MTIKKLSLALVLSVLCSYAYAADEPVQPAAPASLNVFDEEMKPQELLEDKALASLQANCPKGCFLPNGYTNDAQRNLATFRNDGLINTAVLCYNGNCYTRLLRYSHSDASYCYYRAVGAGPEFRIAIYKSELSAGHYVYVTNRQNNLLFSEWTFRCE